MPCGGRGSFLWVLQKKASIFFSKQKLKEVTRLQLKLYFITNTGLQTQPHSMLIPGDQKTLKWSPDVKFWTTRENDILYNTTYIYIYIWFKKLMTPLSSHYWKFCQPALERALPFLIVYKLNLCTSQPHFQGQKSDFSSFLVKEVKFRQIEISQKVNLLFPHRTKAVWKNVCSTVQRHNRNQLQQLCVKSLEFYYFKLFCWQRVCWKVTKLEHN